MSRANLSCYETRTNYTFPSLNIRLGSVFGGLVAIIGNGLKGKARAYLLRNQKEVVTLVCDEDHLAAALYRQGGEFTATGRSGWKELDNIMQPTA